SGSSGNLITFQEHSGETATMTSGVTISGVHYVRITGLGFIGSAGITGNASTQHNTIDHNTFQTTGFRITDGIGSTGSDNEFSFNTVHSNSAGNVVGIYLYGDRNLIDQNEIIATDGDCMDIGGKNVVVRNNYCHDVDGAISAQHIDFVQVVGGGTSPTLSFSLVEHNVERNCTNGGGNCHFIIVRTGT